MREAFSEPFSREPVAVLLHPTLVPVIDVFRSLSSLDDHYDLALLDAPELALAKYTTPEAAKGIVSDALLLAFALTRQRGRPFSHRQIGSRHGSLDEYCLLVLIEASRKPGSDVAREAAAYLDLAPPEVLATLTGELVRQIDRGSLAFDPPTLADLRAITGQGTSEEVVIETALAKTEFNFRL